MLLRLALPLAAIWAINISLADEPIGYYATAEGRTGGALKAALHEIIDDHSALRYSSSSFDTADAMEILDVDPANLDNITLFYSRRSEPASTFPAWNREHVWPNSLGIDGITPAFSDLHNLRPTDSNVNSSRGNKWFDDSTAADGNLRIPSHPEATGNTSDSNSWEPPDSRKGDVARACFYMAVRYEGTAGEPDLELTNDLGMVTTAGDMMGKLTTLILWHLLDPPDADDIARNDGIFTLFQGNRNPFIDRPEWVFEVFGNPLELTMELADGSTTLSWSTDLHRVELESSTDLSQWLPVETRPEELGGLFFVSEPVEQRKFYRLAVK